MKTAGFLGAVRFRRLEPEPPVFTTMYRAPGRATVRAYLEGGDVGRMRAHHDEWLAGRRANLSREVWEENYSVDSDGKPLVRTPELVEPRACFAVRVRVDAEFAGNWSTWYDRDHMPAVVREGGFLRGGRWRLVDDGSAIPRFLVLYEAQSPEIIAAYRKGPGPSFAAEHEAKFGQAVTIEAREVWGA